MNRQRPDEQVVASAAQIDDALTRGLSRAQVVALVVARHAWRVLGQLDPTTVTEDLLAALESSAADDWDAIFVRRARAELSTPIPDVTP